MSHRLVVWLSYVLGFLGTLAFKWGRYVYYAKKDGKTTRQATVEWFFEPSRDNAISWVATIAGVWIVGSIYINQTISITGIPQLPVKVPIAVFVGSIYEFWLPNLVKWISSAIPFGRHDKD